MTPQKTHQTAVVILPPLEVWAPIQDVRRRYDRQFRFWMPHITLMYPFRPSEAFAEVESEFRAVCREVEPFELELVPLHYFEHSERSMTMWLAPRPVEPVVALQAALLRCTPECDDVNRFETGYCPHLSVGQAHGAEELAERMDLVRSALSPIRFAVTEIALLRRGPIRREVFQVDRLISLGSA